MGGVWKNSGGGSLELGGEVSDHFALMIRAWTLGSDSLVRIPALPLTNCITLDK